MAQTYTAKDITVLEGLEPVRKRPAMYIGGTDKTGYHHLLWEILDNSIDEVINHHADRVEVTLHDDGKTVTVDDNGRGIPVDMISKYKKSALEIILTTLHAGGKFEGKNYAHSGGLHGVGASVVNALSESLIAKVKRDGALWQQTFKRGKPAAGGKLKKAGSARGTGTVDHLHAGRGDLRAQAVVRLRHRRRAARGQELPAPRRQDHLPRRDPVADLGADLPARARNRRVPGQAGHRARQGAGAQGDGRLLPRAHRRHRARAGPAMDRVHRRAHQVVRQRRADLVGRHPRHRAQGRGGQGGAQLREHPRPVAQGAQRHRRGHPRGHGRDPVGVRGGAAVPGSDKGAAQQPGGAGPGRRRGAPRPRAVPQREPERGRGGGGARHPGRAGARGVARGVAGGVAQDGGLAPAQPARQAGRLLVDEPGRQRAVHRRG